MTVREITQEMEMASLSPYAMRSADTAGREKPEEECPIRTPFQRDRDRIIHCNSFRRLMNKTQVFLFPQGDHYRTRLTHTLEVGQIARTIVRGLRLNEDLAEAIAMGHDLGHTPFGHAGEYALREVSPYVFNHARQSVRVVSSLEKEGAGLNLTKEVIDGILCHSDGMEWASTAEGKVVRYADKIAYINHDIEDAIRAEILRAEDIPQEITRVLGDTKTRRITTLVVSMINHGAADIGLEEEVNRAYLSLKEFLYANVYKNPVAKAEEGKAKEIVRELYRFYTANPDKLPDFYRGIAKKEGLERAACDYISGMSDRFCISVFEELFIPKPWSL